MVCGPRAGFPGDLVRWRRSGMSRRIGDIHTPLCSGNCALLPRDLTLSCRPHEWCVPSAAGRYRSSTGRPHDLHRAAAFSTVAGPVCPHFRQAWAPSQALLPATCSARTASRSRRSSDAGPDSVARHAEFDVHTRRRIGTAANTTTPNRKKQSAPGSGVGDWSQAMAE